jgi:heat shock protein HslJ
MRSIPTLFLLLLGGLLLGGCGLVGADGPTGGPDRLVGTSWQLTTLRAPDGTTTPVDSLVGRPDSSAAYTLTFRDDGSLGGVADCNSYGADYAARDDGTLSVDELFATEQFCGAASRESLYLDALSSADVYEVDDEGLRVRFDGEGELRFEPQTLAPH